MAEAVGLACAAADTVEDTVGCAVAGSDEGAADALGAAAGSVGAVDGCLVGTARDARAVGNEIAAVAMAGPDALNGTALPSAGGGLEDVVSGAVERAAAGMAGPVVARSGAELAWAAADVAATAARGATSLLGGSSGARPWGWGTTGCGTPPCATSVVPCACSSASRSMRNWR